MPHCSRPCVSGLTTVQHCMHRKVTLHLLSMEHYLRELSGGHESLCCGSTLQNCAGKSSSSLVASSSGMVHAAAAHGAIASQPLGQWLGSVLVICSQNVLAISQAYFPTIACLYSVTQQMIDP